MLKNILAVIGAVTVAAVAYVAFSDHVIVKIEPGQQPRLNRLAGYRRGLRGNP